MWQGSHDNRLHVIVINIQNFEMYLLFTNLINLSMCTFSKLIESICTVVRYLESAGQWSERRTQCSQTLPHHASIKTALCASPVIRITHDAYYFMCFSYTLTLTYEVSLYCGVGHWRTEVRCIWILFFDRSMLTSFDAWGRMARVWNVQALKGQELGLFLIREYEAYEE